MKIKKMWLELILIANLCLVNKSRIECSTSENERRIECSGSSSLAVGGFFKDVWNKSDWSDFGWKISSNISSIISTHKSASADVSEKRYSCNISYSTKIVPEANEGFPQPSQLTEFTMMSPNTIAGNLPEDVKIHLADIVDMEKIQDIIRKDRGW